jgi:alpha-L-fucosidase
MATSWSYVPGDKYKSPQEIIQTLCKIVSRGGNLLLNIGPGPDGEWAADAYDRLEKIGTWMAINSNAIYNSKPVAPYQKDNMVLTQVGNNIYLCYMPKEGETTMPDHIDFPDFPLTEIKSAQLNGSDIELKASVSNNKLHIIIPEKLAQNPPSAYCWVIKII